MLTYSHLLRETTVLRYEADMLFNLKTGDVTLSHGLEANVYTNPSWMVDAFKRRVERMYGTVPAEFRTLNASARIAYLASMSATTSIVTTAPPSVTATGPIATLTTTVSAPTSTASGDSAAGELVVGGSWVAAVAALAAAIVV